jgi:hypothetical protein
MYNPLTKHDLITTAGDKNLGTGLEQPHTCIRIKYRIIESQ